MSDITADLPDPAPRQHRKMTRWIVPGLILLTLAGSLIGNGLLYWQATYSYQKTAEVELDPFGLKHPHFPPDQPAGASSARPTVLFFGDSRALAWPTPPAPGYRYVNRGIGGQTTEQVRGRFTAHVTPLSPQIVIVQAGINDLKAIGLLPNRRDSIVADCKANLRDIISRANAGGATVIVTTIFPPGKVTLERKMIWSPQIEPAVEEVNADLRSLASDRVIVLDAWKLLEDHGRLREGLGVDTLHLNARGYEVLNAELEKVLRSIADR